MKVVTIEIHGEEFVILPKREYEDLVRIPEGTVDALDYARRSIARGLREARETAGLTQAELAKRLRKSQAMISGAENGSVQVGERYVKALLRACGLPPDWSGPKPPRPVPRRAPARRA